LLFGGGSAQMLNNLRERLVREIATPEIVGDRCVHTLTANGSCQACVQACPHEAWILDDAALALDTDRCDGCGLCASACPEGAILIEREPAVWAGPEAAVAFAACDRTGLPSTVGVIPCVHALGLRDLLRLYRLGVRQLLVSQGDCSACPRGGAEPLERRTEQINLALASHGLRSLVVRRLPASVWLEEGRRRAKEATRPSVSRRAFLRRSASRPVAQGLRLAGLLDDERERYVAAGELLPDALAPGGLLPWVPAIDQDRCNGCDACAKLCPHGAISLEHDDQGLRYNIAAARCSGCGLCVDACDQDAVTVIPWQAPAQREVGLSSNRCRACGAPFHLPEGRVSSDGRCRICLQTNHHRNLFQVLD
jgi:ferredoxin